MSQAARRLGVSATQVKRHEGGAAVYEAVRDEWNCTGWRGQADLVDTARGG